MSRKVKSGGTALIMSIVLLIMSASALAAKAPTGPFAIFNDCPTENTKVTICFTGLSTAGGLQLGKINMPIVKPWDLQGGIYENTEKETLEFVPAADGVSLAKTPEEVVGGIFSVVDEWRYPRFLRQFCKRFPKEGVCKVTGTAEIVGTPAVSFAALISEQGVALEVPLRVHLKNELLGYKCYIGSAANPIVAKFTTGTTNPPPPNTPIKGSPGTLEFSESGVLSLADDVLVDNAFSTPKAEGCGGPQSLIVDREIDTKGALPSPSGFNSAELSGTLYLASTESVTGSE